MSILEIFDNSLDLKNLKEEDIKKLYQKLVDYKSLVEIGIIISSESEIDHISKEIVYSLISKFSLEFVVIYYFPDEIQKEALSFIFKKYQKINDEIKVPNFKILKEFFQTHPNQVDFNVFSFYVPGEIVREFNKYNPDIIFPIKTVEDVYGMACFSKPENREFDQDDIEYISHILNFAAVAIMNKKNYLKAIIDLKTGLFIYHYFIQAIISEIEKFKRYNEEFAIIIFDLDDFKKVNDKYGHLAGDYILAEFAKIIINSTRRNIDIPARYGGEEFALLLPHCNLINAYKVAEKIREKLKNREFVFQGEKLHITCSAGVAAFEITDKSFKHIISRADKALYRAKSLGKDQSVANKNNKFIKFRFPAEEERQN